MSYFYVILVYFSAIVTVSHWLESAGTWYTVSCAIDFCVERIDWWMNIVAV